MFNVTGGELVIILFLALMVLGPQRLPQAARTLGKVMSQIRDVSSSFQRELKDAFDEVADPDAKPVSRPLLTAITGGGNDAEPEVASNPTLPDDVPFSAAPSTGQPGAEPAAPADGATSAPELESDALPGADGTRGP